MAKSKAEWRVALKEAFRSGKASDEEVAQALRTGKQINGRPEAAWEGVGYDWLEGLRRLGSGANAQRTLKALLEAGLDPNGGIASFDHIPVPKRYEVMSDYSRLINQGTPRTDARFALRLGIALEGNEDSGQYHMPWMGRTAWLARHLPELPALLVQWVEGGASPHYQFKQAPKGADRELLRNTPWSAWANILATGRVDAVEAVVSALHETGQRPTDWAVSVSSALRIATGRHGEDDAREVVRAVHRFAQQWPPTEEERQLTTRLLAGSHTGRFLRHPKALSLWALVEASDFSKWRPGKQGMPESFNAWNMLGFWDARLAGAQNQLREMLSKHPVWGNPKALQEARLVHQSRERHDVPAQARVYDGWLTGADRGWFTGKGLPEVLPGLLALLGDWKIGPSPAFGELLAKQHDPPSQLTTHWLRQSKHAWKSQGPEGSTPWHFGPMRQDVLDWMKEEGVSGLQRNHAGVPGLMAAAVIYKNLGEKLRYEGAVSAISQWPLKERRGVLVEGLPWSAWTSVGNTKRSSDGEMDATPAQQLQACLSLLSMVGLNDWLRRHPQHSWSSFDLEEQRAILVAFFGAKPGWTKDDKLVGGLEGVWREVSEKLHEALGTSGLLPEALRGSLGALSKTLGQSIYGGVEGLIEGMRWWEGCRLEDLAPSDGKALVRLWWSALSREVQVKQGHSQWSGSAPWETAVWKGMGEREKAGLTMAVFHYGITHRSEEEGIGQSLNEQWLNKFEERVLEGDGTRLILAAQAQGRIEQLKRWMGPWMEKWEAHPSRSAPEWLRSTRASLKGLGLEESLPLVSPSASVKKARM